MLHYGAISMAMGTVVIGIGSYQYALTSKAALYIGWVLWWVSVVLAVASSILLVYLLVSKQTKSIESVTGAWLLLAAPLTVCAASGGTIAEYLPTNLALLTVVASYFLLGAGMPLTCCLVVLYVHRITVYKLPARDIVLTSFIPLGPISQIGVASITLGRIAQEVVPIALPHVEALGSAMFYAGIIGALVSWGCALFALAHAVFSVIYQQRSSKIPFTISWWALVFPIGVFSRLTVDLSETMQLGFFKVVHLMLVTALLVLWLFNMVRTAVGIWTGSIFGISELTEDCTCCACKGDDTQKPETRASGCEGRV
ncbi:Plasma membrane sulfite pump involved in sulfite metabolism [Coemansia interrupta]|uniref:Plasma membrane sulfite pump involved in sulfite metabolism n=1 Tax=Coemansia interrupta TaxID=1126814 RepID=A0A9W8HI61_9FUNG|nr:Plasma membrane sulfite pump involved in sulfite metabolism [Coemansia interrupta]